MGHKVRKTVSVHESTVKKAAKGEAPTYKARKPARKKKTFPVASTQLLHPKIAEWMLDKNVSISDIEIISPTKIIVK